MARRQKSIVRMLGHGVSKIVFFLLGTCFFYIGSDDLTTLDVRDSPASGLRGQPGARLDKVSSFFAVLG
jgi:hypothetical protein